MNRSGRFVWPPLLIVVVVALGTFAAAGRVSNPPATDAAVVMGAATSMSPVPSTIPASTSTGPTSTTLPATTTTAPFDVGLILDGSDWELDAWVDDDGAEAVPRGIRDSTIQFESGVATLDTSCNTGSVEYSIAADQVTFESLTLTEVGCDPLAENVERSIVGVLDGTTTVSFAAGVMFIDRDDLRLVYLAERRD